jgi:acyl-CoA-binding protein
VGRAKYDAWKALAGTSKEEAMRQYAEFAESLVVADKQQ